MLQENFYNTHFIKIFTKLIYKYNTTKIFFVLTALVGIVFFNSCKDNPVDDNPCGGIEPGIVPSPPYNSPIWHPSGEFIGFNHTTLKSIEYPRGKDCWGDQKFADDAGFWLINPDGTNMRRIFPYKLQNPAWSPDGEWIAFNLPIGDEVHIFKMRFTGDAFDTTSLAQLTTAGRNFFPAWSSDGQWIAYNKSICEGHNTCGIWLMDIKGQQHSFLDDYGNYPNWNPLQTEIVYQTKAITQSGLTIGDSLWIYNTNINMKSFLTFVSGDNRNPQYSIDGTKIALWSNGNIWLMDSAGNNKQQLTTSGIDVSFGLPFSWSPDGANIVYTDYRSDDWGYDNGTLWILYLNTGEKKQLTFNINSP